MSKELGALSTTPEADRELRVARSSHVSSIRSHAPSSITETIGRLSTLVSPHWALFCWATASLICAVIANLAVPLLLRQLLDAAERSTIGVIESLAAVLLTTLCAKAVLTFVGEVTIASVCERIVADLRRRVFQQLHRLEWTFHLNHSSGELLAILGAEISTIRTALGELLTSSVTQVITLIGSAILLMSLNARLGALTLITWPIAAGIGHLFATKAQRAGGQLQRANAAASDIVEESLNGVLTVKLFDGADTEFDRYRPAVDQLFLASLCLRRLTLALSATSELIFGSAAILLFWWGGLELNAGRITPGVLIAAFYYSAFVGSAAGKLLQNYGCLRAAAESTGIVFKTLNIEPTIVDGKHRILPREGNGEMQLRNVSYSYPENVYALAEVSLSVAPRSLVAIVGRSGSGKSTLVSLMSRLIDPSYGSIHLDGVDLRDVTLDSLRQHVVLVPQNPTIWSGTVHDNIVYGARASSDAEVRAAARAAGVHELILAMPDAYDTQIGNGARRLSRGEEQRIALARALVRDPCILVLDEATASLDSISEEAIFDVLERERCTRTIVVVTHSIARVSTADVIIVLDAGVIRETGTHQELIERGRYYRALVEGGAGSADPLMKDSARLVS